MKYILKIFWFFPFILFYTWSSQTQAQILWELPLYFTDAAGNKDTVVLGHAPDATKGTDAHLGEIELNNLWSGDFEVRLLYGNSVGGNGDLWENPQYKKMYLKGDGTYGSPAFAMNHIRLSIKVDSLPVTMHYDNSLIGYPSFVNFIQVRNAVFPSLQYWWKSQYPIGHPSHEIIRCMMHQDSIVEDFSVFFWRDSLSPGLGDFGTTIFLENGDTLYTPGFEFSSFTSFANDYYCDRIVGINNSEFRDVDLIVQNPVQDYLQLNSEYIDFDDWRIYDLSGQLILQGDIFYQDMIDLTGINNGLYLLVLQDHWGQVFSERFLRFD